MTGMDSMDGIDCIDGMDVKRAALMAAILASFLTPFTVSSVNIALPAIAGEFRVDAVLLGWIATSYLLSAAVFLVPSGRIADIRGRKKVFGLGVTVFTVASLFAALSPSAEALIAARTLQGVGSAMIFGTGMAILTSVYPPDERGKVLGINIAAVYIGLSLGPFLGGVLTQHFGWRSIFLLNIPLGAAILLILRELRGEWAEAEGEEFDVVGSVIYGIMLSSLIFGLTEVDFMEPLIGISILSFLAFLVWESRARHPVIQVGLFRRNSTFTLSNLAALLNYSATFAVGFLLSLYLQYIKGFSPQEAGIILVSQPVVMALLSPLAGWLSDRVEPRTVASAGMAVITASLLLFYIMDAYTPLSVIIPALMLLGFGFAMFTSPNANAIMGSVERKFYGIASATLGTMRLLGQMFSMAIVMFIFSVYIGKAQITPETYRLLLESIRMSFGVFSIICFTGIFISLGRGKIRE
jgi:EmrB/QacA subfamily drug resistance transporter